MSVLAGLLNLDAMIVYVLQTADLSLPPGSAARFAASAAAGYASPLREQGMQCKHKMSVVGGGCPVNSQST